MYHKTYRHEPIHHTAIKQCAQCHHMAIQQCAQSDHTAICIAHNPTIRQYNNAHNMLATISQSVDIYNLNI